MSASSQRLRFPRQILVRPRRVAPARLLEEAGEGLERRRLPQGRRHRRRGGGGVRLEVRLSIEADDLVELRQKHAREEVERPGLLVFHRGALRVAERGRHLQRRQHVRHDLQRRGRRRVFKGAARRHGAHVLYGRQTKRLVARHGEPVGALRNRWARVALPELLHEQMRPQNRGPPGQRGSKRGFGGVLLLDAGNPRVVGRRDAIVDH
mmetsp:Transcript_16592/g.51644  ORF Transcript_16592/g.51644 Transcript_16592/m.51644 type:complete len:208 (+) Transcript_16592:215-838(+)